MALERGKMLDKTRRISHMENTHMPYILPLVQLTTIAKLKADDCLHSLISERRALPVTDSDHESMSVLAASSSQESPLCKLKKRLHHLLKVMMMMRKHAHVEFLLYLTIIVLCKYRVRVQLPPRHLNLRLLRFASGRKCWET